MRTPAGRAGATALLCAGGMLLPLLSQQLAGAGGRMAWLIDLASHWQWAFLAGLVLAGTLAAWRRRGWAVLLAAAALPALTAAPRAPQPASGTGLPAGHPAASPALAVASANVHLLNRDVQPLARWLAAEQPDAVVLLEVSPAFAAGLQALPGYPFRKIVASDTPFGIALLSRHPLLQADVVAGDAGVAQLRARLLWQGRPIHLAALHPMPPLSPHFHAARDAQLRAAAEAATGQPAVLAGDFNATPWSSAFVGLGDLGFRRAGSLRPTWPAIGRGLMGIPIDQVAVSPHWAVASSRLGPALGSDHLPVLVRLVLQAPAAAPSPAPGG
jgi:endonuclease/exonuclease/phosphatase (EEP) superfamily protein YafD